MFTNDDLKYEVNKLRAEGYASKSGTGIMYCPAKDTPTADALRVPSDLASLNVSWLNRHDPESGDSYGMLPLIQGMPVAMTDHKDWNIEKRIIRGRVGYVNSWVLADEEKSVFENGKRMFRKLHRVVLVDFVHRKGKSFVVAIAEHERSGTVPDRTG